MKLTGKQLHCTAACKTNKHPQWVDWLFVSSGTFDAEKAEGRVEHVTKRQGGSCTEPSVQHLPLPLEKRGREGVMGMVVLVKREGVTDQM